MIEKELPIEVKFLHGVACITLWYVKQFKWDIYLACGMANL